MRLAGLLALGLLLLGSAGWGVLALYYFDHANFALRVSLAAAFALVSLIALAAFALTDWRWHALAGYAVLLAALLWRWSAVEPSNDRDWRPEAARLSHATVAGEEATLHDIRNFDYRSESDFTPSYYDRTFDLRQLDSVDLLAVYWMGPEIAHIMLSFGFAGRDYLAVSIETRKERSEEYSTVKGFFRQYELFYVVADERDVIRVRTNYRKDPPEEVYLFRVHGPTENGRRLFLDYVREINSLKEHAEFYNTLTTNCTTNIFMHTRVNPGHMALNWKLVLSGYTPAYVYEQGRLDTSLPLEELKKRSRINDAARAADHAPDFSQKIRAGLPGVNKP